MWIETKCNAWQLTSVQWRPWPLGTQSIGTWQHIMDVLTVCTVVVNGAVLVFTKEILIDYSDWFKFWIFLGFQWVLLTVLWVLRVAVRRVPPQVQVQREREAFLNRKLIERSRAEEDQRDAMAKLAELETGGEAKES